jgi:xylulokinase
VPVEPGTPDSGGSGERWVLAVDLGTGGPKVAVVGLDGQIHGTALRAVHLTVSREGEASQDADEWWTTLLEAAREAIEVSGVDRRALHAVAITGQYGSTVPVGADGSVVGPALLWADSRARDLVRPVVGGPISVSGFAPHKVLPFIRVTGGVPSPNGADPTGHALLLRERMGEVYACTSALLEPVDFLGLRLTGRVAATPASMLASWLTDNRIGAPFGYSADMVSRARRDAGRLPELVPTGSVLGPMLDAVADELGVAPHAPVVTGIPDLHAAVVGSGAVGLYQTHVSISTTAWIGARVPFKKTDAIHSIATVPGLDERHPIVANNHETGGAALQWLREQVIAPPDGLLGGGSGIGDRGLAPEAAAPSFDDLTALAATAPAGSEGLLFTPWLSGERSPVDDKLLRGGWLNVSLRTDRAAMVRSVLEGVAYNARWLFEPYQKFVGRTVPSVRILGGGAQSDLWCQIHADILGVPVEQVEDPRDAQLRGVALWARVCLGELRLEEAGAMVRVRHRFEPTAAHRAAYDSGYGEFRRLYGTLKGLYHRLNGRRG